MHLAAGAVLKNHRKVNITFIRAFITNPTTQLSFKKIIKNYNKILTVFFFFGS